MIRTLFVLLAGFGLAATAFADSADIDKVNGSIHVDDNSTAGKLTTVNGGIHVGANAHAGSVETVNGGIDIGAGAGVASVETVNGDVTVGANSRVEGGIFIDEDHSMFHWGTPHKPRIVIGPHAVVQGKLTFKREVELFVSDSATIGAVEGATAQKFSGDQPPQ